MGVGYSELNIGDKVTILTKLFRRPKQTGIITHFGVAAGYEGLEMRLSHGSLFLPQKSITKIIRHLV